MIPPGLEAKTPAQADPELRRMIDATREKLFGSGTAVAMEPAMTTHRSAAHETSMPNAQAQVSPESES